MLDTLTTAGTGIEPSRGAEQGRERQGTVGLFTNPRREERTGKEGLCPGTVSEILLRRSRNFRSICVYKPT